MDPAAIEDPMSVTIDLRSAQKRVATNWFIGALTILLLMIARNQLQQAFTCDTADKSCDAAAPWQWWGSAFVPTLSLMVGALLGTSDNNVPKQVDRFVYKAVLGLSFIYFLVCLIPVLARGMDPSLALQKAMWIPPIQGLVTAAVGRLYGAPDAKQEKAGSAKSSP
jgi:hypothetical protein